MRIAFIDKKEAKVSVENEVLKVDLKKIPLRLIDTVVLGSLTYLNSRDMVKLTQSGVTLLMLSAKGDQMAITQSAKSKNAEIKLAQFEAQSSALNFAKYFVTHKLKRHTVHLYLHEMVLDISQELQSVEDAQSIETLLGIEGSFARRYFSFYFELFPKRLHLCKRSKRPPLDPVNAMLSFFYMLTYNLISIRLISFGFEPSIGFLHQPFRSHNALASDFMELFRADVNEFVWSLFHEKKLESSDFTKKDGVYLKYEGRKKIWVDFKLFHQSLESQIDAEIAKLRLAILEKGILC